MALAGGSIDIVIDIPNVQRRKANAFSDVNLRGLITGKFAICRLLILVCLHSVGQPCMAAELSALTKALNSGMSVCRTPICVSFSSLHQMFFFPFPILQTLSHSSAHAKIA